MALPFFHVAPPRPCHLERNEVESRDLLHHQQSKRFLDSADAPLGMTYRVDVGIDPYKSITSGPSGKPVPTLFQKIFHEILKNGPYYGIKLC